jgi:hypothetical protein
MYRSVFVYSLRLDFFERGEMRGWGGWRKASVSSSTASLLESEMPAVKKNGS